MVDLSELIKAANAAPVESQDFYGKYNKAIVQVAKEANANTPETQIQAEAKELQIAQQRTTQTLSAVMEAHAKDTTAYETYQQDYLGRKADYDMLQSKRLNNLSTLTEGESDPKKNNILLSPFKTIASVWRSSQIKEENAAIVEEMNALGQEMGQATKEWIATHQHNQEKLAFTLQTEVELNTRNALMAAQQESRAAQLRYADKQDDIAKLTTATTGLRTVSAASEATRAGLAKSVPTREEAAYYYAQKTKTPHNPSMPDELYNQVVRAYQSEPEEVRNANAQSFLRYDQYIKSGAGSTDSPSVYAARQISTSTDGQYARALDTLNDGRYSEIADIGLQLQVERVAASLRQGNMDGVPAELRGNPAVMKQLTAAQGIADQTAQQLAVKAALEGSFKDSLDSGIDWIRQDIAGQVTDATATDPRRYATPVKVSGILTNPDFLVSQIPAKYLEGQDLTTLQAEADVVAKVSGMRGGDPQAHKFLAANDFLKSKGVTDEYERNNIMHKWLQLSLRTNYTRSGVYASLTPLVQETMANRSEEFTVPILTRPIKATSTIFGASVPALPEVDLSSLSGFATYMKAIQSGAVQQAKEAEAATTVRQSFGYPTGVGISVPRK